MTKHRLLGIVIVLLVMFGWAAAAWGASYYIPPGTDTPDAYPTTGDFNWIRTGHSYGYSSAFSYTDGGNLSYDIGFTLYAPDNWTNEGGNDYTGYRPDDDGYSYGGNVNSEMSGGQSDFNNVYAYFYEITNTGSENLTSLEINYSNAVLADFGYINGAGTAPTSMNDASDSQININFGTPLVSGAADSSTFYLTSRSWYGWDTAAAAGSSGGSASGNLPSPNPEASTMLLYLVGLVGVSGYTYLKKHGMGAWL